MRDRVDDVEMCCFHPVKPYDEYMRERKCVYGREIVILGCVVAGCVV